MDDRPVPDLEELDELRAREFLEEMYAVLSAEWEYALRHEDYALEMPQSGERVRGRENMRAFQQAFPANSPPPTIRIRRVVVRGNVWVVEEVHDYGGGETLRGVSIIELKDGRVWRDTRYFAGPFEAPDWRTRWVERMES